MSPFHKKERDSLVYSTSIRMRLSGCVSMKAGPWLVSRVYTTTSGWFTVWLVIVSSVLFPRRLPISKSRAGIRIVVIMVSF